MKRVGLSFCLLLILTLVASAASAQEFVPVCERSPDMRAELENVLQKPCAEITPDDLRDVPVRIGFHLFDTEVLKAGDLSGLSHLTALGLFGPFHTIELGAFRGLSALELLNISTQTLAHIDPLVFQDVPNLRQLSLVPNRFPRIDPELFRHLSGLETLAMHGSLIREIPLGTFDLLQNLRTLSIGSSPLEYLPDGLFDSLPSLLVVNVEDSPLTRTSAAAFRGVPTLIIRPNFGVQGEREWRP